MRTIFSTRRLALYLLAAVPFVLIPVGMARSVEPLARLGAAWCRILANSLPAPSEDSSGAGVQDPPSTEEFERSNAGESIDEAAPAGERARGIGGDIAKGGGRSKARAAGEPAPSSSLLRGAPSKGAAVARRARANVFLGPESIQRAIPVPGRPTSAWTDRTADHPAGLLIRSPGALGGMIEAGDILVEAEGQPLGSFEQLITTVRQAYERRAKRLSGRLFRKGDIVPLTVEPGW